MKGSATARKAQRRLEAPEGPWLTPNQAGRLLGITRPTVLARVVDGTLEAETRAGNTYISRASVERALGQKATAK